MSRPKLINEIPSEILAEFLEQVPKGVILALKVKTNASKEKFFISGIDECTLAVCAPALKNAANFRVIELISELFLLSKSSVSIISGEKSRHKRLLLLEQNVDRILEKLEKKYE